MNNLSVFGGTGFIGGKFCQLYPDKVTLVPRDGRNPTTKDVLYFISTTTNQSVFKDLHVDIDTNLTLLMDVLSNCRDKDITFNFVVLVLSMEMMYWMQKKLIVAILQGFIPLLRGVQSNY